MRKTLMTLVSSTALIAGMAFVAPAFAEDELMNELKAVIDQDIDFNDQIIDADLWADSDYGDIDQTLENLQVGGAVDISATVDMSDCNCFNDVTATVDADVWQAVTFDTQQITASLGAVTGPQITQMMTNTQVGGLVGVSSDIATVDLP